MTQSSVTPDLFRGPPHGTIAGMRERHPCVYLMASGFNGTLYAGVTSNLLARVVQHREGAFDGFTKRHGINRLVWFVAFPTMIEAIAHEKRIKKWPRDWKKNLIERDNPAWEDLAVGLGLDPLGAQRGGPRNKSGVTGGTGHQGAAPDASGGAEG